MLTLLRRDRRVLIGVVHLLAGPGAPRFAGSVEALLHRARGDAAALVAGGCDAVIVENFGDVPFFKGPVPPESVATLALALAAVREAAPRLPVGVNVLRNDARAALGLCAATGASFLRVNVHTGAAVTDQGLMEGDAANTLRERARLCPGAAILADVHVKHASPLGRESTGHAAEDALRRGLADAVIVTGRSTGRPPDAELLAEVRASIGEAPLLVGSGLDEANAAGFLRFAEGAIVGTFLKHQGRLAEPVDAARVERLRRIFDAAG
ncbi:MAG: BtpA/SgcQ family protein [Planctomycetes bacterium]|nr:BtpA/SgcQ family protein [Planctomycetota bacterium]